MTKKSRGGDQTAKAEAQWMNRITGSGDVDPQDLLANPKNWAIHPSSQQDALLAVLKEIGWVGRVMVNKRTGFVVDGHARVALALREQQPSVPVDYVELDEHEENLVLATFDMITRGRVTDAEKLQELLSGLQIQDPALRSFVDDFAKLEGLNKSRELPVDPGADLDQGDALKKKWDVKTGQLWQLGAHRLICGSCTDADVVRQLMDGTQADIGVTSPPYGVGKAYEQKGIEPWKQTVQPGYRNMAAVCKVVVINIGDLLTTGGQFIEPTFAYTIAMMGELNFRPIWIRVWEKPGLNFGVGPYHLVSHKPVQQYEYVGAFAGEDSVAAETPVEIAEFEWMIGFAGAAHKFVQRLEPGDRRAWGYRGIWEMNTVAANDDHPAMFPLELPERVIKMHSSSGGGVLDPFLGSGTTLIACERLGRRGFGIELDPKYVAVAIERWHQMTGQMPELIK